MTDNDNVTLMEVRTWASAEVTKAIPAAEEEDAE